MAALGARSDRHPDRRLFHARQRASGMAWGFDLIRGGGFLWRGRGHNATVLFSLAFGLTAIGFSAAQLSTHLVAAPILERSMTGALSERVLQVEAFASGPRILLDNIRLRNLPADGTPERVRLRLRAADLPEVGSRISVFARLLPPGPPRCPEPEISNAMRGLLGLAPSDTPSACRAS